MRRPCWIGAVVVRAAWLAAVAPSAVVAQASAVGEGAIGGSPWLTRWSALRPAADLGIPAPTGPLMPQLLALPAPRIGLAWSAGNPAALPDELDSSWVQLAFTAGGTSGDYHAPSAAASEGTVGAELAGWRRIGSNGAAVGRAAIERATLGSGTYAIFAAPAASSPFVPMNTSRPASSRPVVTLEGAQGVALGGWRLGMAGGYRASENNSNNTSAALIDRASAAGVVAGAVRALGGVRVGLTARVLVESETAYLLANPFAVRVYVLDGYASVEPADVQFGLQPFYRRSERTSSAFGAHAAGRALGAQWVVYGETQALRERQIPIVLATPPTDRWTTDGVLVGAVAQRRAGHVLATARAEWNAARGEAQRSSDLGGIYQTKTSRMAVLGDVRYASATSPWMGAAVVSLDRAYQWADDRGARATSDVTVWSPALAVEIAKRIESGVVIAAGYGMAQYTPNAVVPSLEKRGRGYTLLVAPAVELAAATARARTTSADVRWRAAGREVRVRIWQSSLEPTARPDPSVPLPPGSRSVWGIAFGVEPGRR